MKRLIPILFLTQNALAAFGYYSPLTVVHTQVPSTQTNFTVLINVTDARFKTVGNGGHVQNSSGFDIRPYSDSGLSSALSYELGSYNASTGAVILWVMISSLSSSVDTPIYLGYGDATLTTDGSSTSAWDSNFKAIWHLQDNAATTTIKESTATGATATNIANTSTKTTTGQIGNALNYNGSTDASSAALDLSALSIVTVSFWLNWTTNANDDHLAFEYTNNYNSKNGFIVDWNESSGAFGFGLSASGASYWTDKFTRPSAGAWHWISLVMDRTNRVNKGYLDGSAQTLTPITHNVNPFGNFDNDTLYFMSRATSSLNAAGIVDEVRVSSIERAQNWITTEYNNQSNAGTFETLGTEVVNGAATTNRVPQKFFFFP